MAPDTPISSSRPESETERVERLLSATKLALTEHEAIPSASASYVRLLCRRVRRLTDTLEELQAADELRAEAARRLAARRPSTNDRAIANAVARERRAPFYGGRDEDGL